MSSASLSTLSPYLSAKKATDPARRVLGSRSSRRAAEIAPNPTARQNLLRPASSNARNAPSTCKVIDASQQGSSLRYGLHLLASKFECSQELSTGLQLGREPVSRQPLPQHGSSAGKPHTWRRTGDLGRKLPTNPLRSRRI